MGGLVSSRAPLRSDGDGEALPPGGGAAKRRSAGSRIGPQSRTSSSRTLLMTGHDWDQPRLWRRSMELLATDVMPRFQRHADATLPA